MERVHASCVMVAEHVLLIQGPSGSGKSSLVWSLICQPPMTPHGAIFTRLIADDQTCLYTHHGRLLASPPPQLAGKIELRGQGIFAFPMSRVRESRRLLTE